MKKIAAIGVMMTFLLMAGCSSNVGSAGLGAVGGAAVGVGGYEYHLKKERDKIEQDYKDGKIDKKEYDIRIDQNRKDSPF